MSKPKGKKLGPQPVISGKKLTQPLVLEDGKVPGLLRNLTYIVCAILGIGIVWASVSEIRELAIGQGKIVPASSIKAVHHLEGGIVEKVLGKEGQRVRFGAPILRLSPVVAESDLKQLESRQIGLMLQKSRLTALLNMKNYAPRKVGASHDGLVKDQVALFNSQLALIKREAKTLQARIKQRALEIKAYDKELESLVRQLAVRGDQVKVAKELYDKKLSTRGSLLELKLSYEEVLARSLSLNGRRVAAREALKEARSILLESQIKNRQAFTAELTKVSIELSELSQILIKQRDKVKRLVVRAPVSGIVQHLPFHTKGEVIKPGELVAKIVPNDGKVVAEVRIDPKDIGHIKTGDKAELKISTFDPNKFGVVNGQVKSISASSFQTERGETYFKAIIALDKNTIGQANTLHNITPGMVLQADIVTGSKTLVQYMLKPVYRSLNTAFTER